MPEIKNYLRRVTVSQGPDDLEEKCTVEIDELAGGYARDQDFTLDVGGEQREFFVSRLSRKMSAPDDGRVQTVEGVSPIAKKVKLSPGKRLVFTTMSPEQHSTWLYEFGGKESSLEFVPYIKIGNAYGEKGWTAKQIAQVLADAAGISIQIGLMDYDVKNYEVSEETTYINAIASLWSIFEPAMDYIGGTVFLMDPEHLDGSFISGNVLTVNNPVLTKYDEVREEKPLQIRVTGTLGRFRVERFKGPLSGEPYQWKKFYAGDIWVLGYAYGFDTQSAERTMHQWSSGGLTYTLSEKITTVRGKDVFGKPAFLLLENRETWLRSSGAAGGSKLISRNATVYDFRQSTHASQERPIEFGRLSSNAAGVYYPDWEFSLNGWSKVIKQTTSVYEQMQTVYEYEQSPQTPLSQRGEGGILKRQETTTWGLVYVLDGEYRPLKTVSDTEGAGMSSQGESRWMLMSVETINYGPVHRDSYMVFRDVVSLQTDGSYKSNSDMQSVQSGGPQQSPVSYRQMQVYAEDGVSSGAMSTPAHTERLETPSWEAVEEALRRIKPRLQHDTVEAEFEVRGVLNLRKGMPVNLQNITDWDGKQITLPALDPAYTPRVVSYNTEEDLYLGIARTRFTVEGRLL